MRRIFEMIGRCIWICGWPAMWLLLRDRRRTRIVLINDTQQVLVVRGWISGSHRWSLPGGGLHTDEEPLDGALREVSEEVGISLQRDDITALPMQHMSSKGFRSYLYPFTAHVHHEPTLKLQWYEIAQAAWVDRTALTPRTAEPDVIAIIEALDGRV